ncbi:MAG: tellurite resistance protein TerC, partial [Thermoleophilaceae bacterium]|nr:tellurite resistance protein TerC [Thermoleophilaceae bacterium]
DDAGEYLTVYRVERSLSLDNLFVFLMLFAYFAVPSEHRPKLLFWGIAAALVMRGAAIFGGVALIEQFHFVVYLLGAGLLVLAYRIFRSSGQEADPERNFVIRTVKRVLPVSSRQHGSRFLARENGSRVATPLMVCLVAIVQADIAFAIDSIPAAFGITRDPFSIWMGNVFALLGLRALFVLVEGLARRFRYLDETIALVLGIVGVKLLTEDLVKIGPVASLAIIGTAFAAGILASLTADRRDAQAKKNTSPSTA